MNIRWLAIRDKMRELIKRKNPLPSPPEIETSSNPEKDDDSITIKYYLVVAKYHDRDYYIIIKEEKKFNYIYVLSRNFPFKKNIGIYTLRQLINTVENDCVSEVIDWREVLQRVNSGYKIIKEYNIKQIKRGD